MTNDKIGDIPFASKKRRVRKSWIDYNGHMNVAYYTLAFDQAIDEFLESVIGIRISPDEFLKEGSYALQTQYRYLNELLLGEIFYVSIFVADFNQKQMHLMLEMIAEKDKKLCASCETIMINVDLKQRRSCPYPKFAIKILSRLYNGAKALRASTVIGHPIGLRKKM